MEFLKWYSLVLLSIIEVILAGTLIFNARDWKTLIAFLIYAPVLIYLLINI